MKSIDHPSTNRPQFAPVALPFSWGSVSFCPPIIQGAREGAPLPSGRPQGALANGGRMPGMGGAFALPSFDDCAEGAIASKGRALVTFGAIMTGLLMIGWIRFGF